MKNLIKELRISLMATLLLAAILCGVYPLIIWVLGQGLFEGRTFGILGEPRVNVLILNLDLDGRR